MFEIRKGKRRSRDKKIVEKSKEEIKKKLWKVKES